MGQFTSFPIPNATLTSYTNYVYLKDFGAAGDGSTDDTAAINSCFASLAGSAGTVVIGPGTYKITDTIVVGNKTGGNAAATSFINIVCPAGANNTVFNYSGPSDGRAALLFAKNKYFLCQGLNVERNGAIGSSIGIILGGSGTGASGTQTLASTFLECSVGGFNIGITDGNSGAASEITFIELSLLNCNTGWVVNDFNSLDHTFICLNMSSNGIGLDTGATECHWVFGGSSSSNGIDFKVQSNSSDFTVTGYRSEGAGIAVSGLGGKCNLRNCLFKDPANGGLGVGTSISGQFGSIDIDGCHLHGFITFSTCGQITMTNNDVPGNPQTNLPFSVQSGQVNHGATHVFLRNNVDFVNSPSTVLMDFDGFLKDAEFMIGAPLFSGVIYGNAIQKIKQELRNANTGSPFPFDYLSLGYVRQLAEGPSPNAANAFTTTLTTNATTAIGSNVLHFASVPATITPGMAVVDQTVGAIPSSTFVLFTTSTTVTISKNVAVSNVGNGDTIFFSAVTGAITSGKNLRVMGQFASSGTLSLTFTRSVTANTGGSQNATFVASTGIFFPSDVGKPFKVAGAGNSGWTDFFGAGFSYTDSTHLVVESANMQPPSINAPGSTAVIGENEPDGNYMVVVTGNANETFWVTNITNTGFTVHSSNAASTAIVTALIIR